MLIKIRIPENNIILAIGLKWKVVSSNQYQVIQKKVRWKKQVE